MIEAINVPKKLEFGNVFEDYVYDVVQNDAEDGVHIFVSDDGGD